MKPYSNAYFVKQCLVDVAQEMCPKMVTEFEKISQPWWKITRHINCLANDTCDNLRDKVKRFVSWSFATDKSMDQKDRVHLTVIVKGVDNELNEMEQLCFYNL